MNKKIKKTTFQVNSAPAPTKPTSPPDNLGFFLTEFKKISEEINKENLGGVRKIISQKVAETVSGAEISKNYKTLFLLQDDVFDISNSTLDNIYLAVKNSDSSKPLLLILNSPGGYIGPAYFISSCCKEYSSLFCVAVPRRAKSAATLIALGADQIHMGSISELGPIDPQIRKLPALALGEAVEFLASISEKHQGSAEMFARFLSRELDLQTLGHTRRIAESAAHYAELLLGTRKLPKPAKEISNHLVNGYKDHSFVIDKREAKIILGESIIKANTPEYELADKVYKLIEEAKLALWVISKETYLVDFVGDADSIWLRKEGSN